jgi:2-polyprenyl-3-methyl-5-hydroxy-6-metoxy-1,4-benzoquinol methylase
MTVVDVGCAMGFFSIPLARMVGPDGRVVCVDLQEKMLQSLRRRAKRTGLSDRMEIRMSSKNSLDLEIMQGQVDLVCALFVIHEMPNPNAFFHQAYKLLRPAGKMLIMEPKGHTSTETFDLFCQLAEYMGFNQVPYHLPKMRHAVLLEK